jgi:uncharacterized protein involved in type VI secretion and phage assembly
VAKNFFSLVQEAFESGSVRDARHFGVTVGIVTSNDPSSDKQAPPWAKHGNAVKIKYVHLPVDPQTGQPPESDWARVAQPAAGAGRGFYWVPEVNDEVLVAFERGEVHRPYVVGCLWNGQDKPIKGAFSKDNTTRWIQTKSGHRIVFEDKKGAEKIVVADSSGKRTMTFDVKNKKFIIEAKEGDVEIHAKKKIVLSCEDLEIKTGKTGKIDIGTTFDLNVSGKANIWAGPQLNIKASRVNIN